MIKHTRFLSTLAVAALLSFAVAACGSDDTSGSGNSTNASASTGGDVKGKITIDGSSTVGPFTEAAAELFNEDIPDASRPIKPDEEAPVCKKNNVTYGEVQVANDGIAVTTNPELKVDCLTTDQLKKLWNKGSKVANLSEIDPKLPDTKLSLYGPGTDSGTFDFFTGAINGEEGVSRKDYEASEDDNQLVTGVEGDKGGLGYFGFSYYEGAQDKLNLVGVDDGSGTCVKPSKESIQ